MNAWELLLDGREAPRLGRLRGQHRLVFGDLCLIVDRLRALDYPPECPVVVATPLPPKDRRIVDITVHDFTYINPEGNIKSE